MSFHEEQDHFRPFKKYEYILNSRTESFENKIASLLEVWKSIAKLDLLEFDLRHVIQIMDWAKLHALNIVLTAEWDNYKAKYQDILLQEIDEAQNELLKFDNMFETPCKKLADVVKKPWGSPILRKLMNVKDAEIGLEEINFFCAETAYLVSVRLKKLCESHCEDLALNLVTAFMKCNKLSKSQNFTMHATETQIWFIFDIYIALLYKYQQKQKMGGLLKELSLDEGLQLVKRFSKKRVKISKIWKNCNRIAIYATQMYISQVVLKYSNDLQAILEQYIEMYISLYNSDNLQDFSDSIRRMSNLAEAAEVLYVFCDVIQRKEGQKLKPFIIEMYIRALTTDMNELEKQKDAKDTEKVQVITQRLATAFMSLAHFLDEHVNVARECVLTAFSLAPTSDKLQKIEELARRSGYEVGSSKEEWKCRLHPPALSTDEVTWICPQCGDWMSKPSLELPKINIALHEALQNSVLGISEALCDDLVVCLSNPRYQVLSWFLPWNNLHRLCLMYLEDPQNTKNIVTELKFVDIDYSIFKDIKREPQDELAGIERGYEQYLDQNFVSDEESISNSEDSMSQDSRPYSLGSDGAGDGVFVSFLPTTPQKSDPNTLKSLRMFRPNLKRVKEKDLGESSPEKVFKPCTIVREPEASTSQQNLSSGSSEVLPSTSTSSNLTSSDDSKNVKTATLPQLGGQVARTEIKATQESKKLTLKELLSASMNLPRRDPPKLSKKKSSTSAEQTCNQKTQKKPLLIGSSGSSKQKPNKEGKCNTQLLKKLIVKIPMKDLDLRKTPHPQHSVLTSQPESSIQPLEQNTGTKSPPLVVKIPLISYPPHPRHRKAIPAVQDKLQETTPCISSNIQPTKAIEKPRPALVPVNTQPEINSHLSETQLMISLQPASQTHTPTDSKQNNPCQTETSSLLENQIRAPAPPNTQKVTQEPQPVTSKVMNWLQLLPGQDQRSPVRFQISSHPQKIVRIKTNTSKMEREPQDIPLNVQTSQLHQTETPLPISHSQIIEKPQQTSSQVRQQEVQSAQQAGPSCIQEQSPLTGNQVACQQLTPPKNQKEVAEVDSMSKIVQQTLEDLIQSTAQGIILSPSNPANSISPTEQLEMLADRLKDSLIVLTDVQEEEDPLAAMMEERQMPALNKSPQRSPVNSRTIKGEIHRSTLKMLENHCMSLKLQETPPKDLQAVEVAPKTPEIVTCPTGLSPASQENSPSDSVSAMITEIVSQPAFQEQGLNSCLVPTLADWFPSIPYSPTTEREQLLESQSLLGSPKYPEINLTPPKQQQQQQDSQPRVGTEVVNPQSSREQTQDSSVDPSPQWSPLSGCSQTKKQEILRSAQKMLESHCLSPKSQETNQTPTKVTVTSSRDLQPVEAAPSSPEVRSSQKGMSPASQLESPSDSQSSVTTSTSTSRDHSSGSHSSTTTESIRSTSRTPDSQSSVTTETTSQSTSPESSVDPTPPPWSPLSPCSQTTKEELHRSALKLLESQCLPTSPKTQETSRAITEVVSPLSPSPREPQTTLKSTVHRPQETSTFQEELDLPLQPVSLLDSPSHASVEVKPTGQETTKHLQQLSPPTIFIEDSPPPRSSEMKCNLEKQSSIIHRPTEINPTPQQTPLVGRNMQPVVKLVRLVIPPSPKHGQRETMSTSQEEVSLDKPLPKTHKAQLSRCSPSIVLEDSQSSIQPPPAQEPSVPPAKTMPEGYQCLPRLQVAISPILDRNINQHRQKSQRQLPVTESPKYRDCSVQTEECYRELRVVISPYSQRVVKQRLLNRRGLSPVTQPRKGQNVKNQVKRLGQEGPSNTLPRKRGRPRKHRRHSHDTNRPSSLPQFIPQAVSPQHRNIRQRPKSQPRDIPQRPKSQPRDIPQRPKSQPWDIPQRPKSQPQDIPQRPISQPWDIPRNPSPLPLDIPQSLSPPLPAILQSLNPHFRCIPQTPSPRPPGTYTVYLMNMGKSSPNKTKTKQKRPMSPPLPVWNQDLMSLVSQERLELGRAIIAEICKQEWPTVTRWPPGDIRNIFDASRILHDFFSRRRALSPELPLPIHIHSTRFPSSSVRIHQTKVEGVPFLVEEKEDLSCLTDPTLEPPTMAILQDQVCLFHHKRLRTGKGIPSIIYQRTVEQRKRYLEMWSDDSGSDSELELDMEDLYRQKSILLVIAEDPEAWAVWVGRRAPRPVESQCPLSPRTPPRQRVKRGYKRRRNTSTTRPTKSTKFNRTYASTSTHSEDDEPQIAYTQPSNVAAYEYEQYLQRQEPDYKLEQRKMRKARRIIRREKAELRILAEMKRMSDLAFDELRNSESDEPSPEVVDLDLFIDFLKGRGKQPLRYKRVNLPHGVIKRLPKRVPSPSRIITKELRVNICRLTKKEIEEKTSKKNRAKLASESLNRSKSSKKSCESDLNGNKVASKGKPDDNDSDLENTNQRNTDHESNQRATPDTNQLDKRTPLVLLHNVAARSVLANVPGLNDFHLMQPQNVDQIINVVQVPGAKTQMQTTSQTSTPVTAHIQRIGQPRPSEQKPENSTPVSTNISNVVATSTSTGHTTTKTQPSTLINILSQQVIRPANIVPCGSAITGNSNGHTSNTNTTSSGNNSNSTCSSGNSSSTTTPTRRPPFINILSQQIIRPTQASKGAPNNGAYTVTETVLPKPAVTESVSSTANNLTRPTITTTTVIPKTTSIVTTSQGLASGNISSSIPDSASNSPGTAVGNNQGSTIVQFICKSALPKFQQAFGKTVYQCTAETTESSTVSESSNAPTATICTIPVSTVTPSTEVKKNATNVAKAVPVNVQSIQGNVIYSRQVPVGQTINLVPPTGATRQVFRIATSNPEQLSLVKDSVIHSKMSALLAAALQSRPKNAETEIQVQDDGTKITLTRPALVQNARIVKPVQLQLPTNVVRAPQPNLSSTTLEQLREFDMVYKQIKERSSNTTPTEISAGEQTQEVATPQRISVTYVNQLPKYTQLSPVVVVSSYSHLQQAATSPALSVTSQSSLSPCTTPTSTPSTAPKITTKTTKALIVGKTFKNHTNNSTTKTSPISKPQQKPQEDEHTTQRIFDILAEYAEQLRNSPDLNNKPAPRRRSNPPTNPSQNSKRKKSSSSTKKTVPANSNVEIDTDDITVGSEDSSGGGMVQLSVTDDEQSQSQAATTSTVESGEATTPSCPRQVILTDNASVSAQPRNVIIADSSVGEALKMSNTAVIVPGSYIMPVSMVKGGQQIAVMSGGSKILATVPARSGQNMLLFQSFTNQNRKGAISAVKYSSLQSVSGISSQSIAGVSAQPPVILPSNSVATAVAIGQQLALKKIGEERESGEVLLTISQKEDTQPDSVTSVSSDSEDVKIPDQSNVKVDQPNEKIIHTYQKPISANKAYTVIATSINSQKVHQEPCAQPSVINTTKVSTTLNGPMLSHTTTNRFRKVTDSERTIIRGSEVKEDSTHNGAKVIHTEPKTYRSSAIYYTNKAKKVTIDSQKPESDAQKQAMLERELRLQKSLSEECEDLGVDEPSTSDLFPEADLLFDSNHSPSFDQNSQEAVKKGPHGTEKEEGSKSSINLFSDDDNSSSLKSDLFEYVEYHTVESALDHQAKQLMNGNNPETESSSCEDNTLLPKCSNMSEVTLNSPISPEVYAESSINKYKFKYTNRKKSEKIKQSDSGGETITNSEDAVSSADSCKLSSEEENYKVVHVAITKSDVAKEESRCELHVCEEFVDSPSGRGARRSVRKLCSCCNGAQDGHHAARKRPNPSRPQTPATPHKKPFLKKR